MSINALYRQLLLPSLTLESVWAPAFQIIKKKIKKYLDWVIPNNALFEKCVLFYNMCFVFSEASLKVV